MTEFEHKQQSAMLNNFQENERFIGYPSYLRI